MEFESSDILKVGDTVGYRGRECKITALTVTPTPHKDCAGELNGVKVQEVEYTVPFVADLSIGKWAYGSELAKVRNEQ